VIKGLRCILFFVLVAMLAGCESRIDLLREQSEEDANEVIAALSSNHIEADKIISKDGFAVMINSVDMARAVKILDAKGLPRKTRTNFGDVFKKEGVISTPLEERARYLYATSQELESTLNLIEGVVVSRVHVVLPEKVAPGEPVQPASAAVFIKHLPELDPDIVRPRIKRMIENSIPGLTAGKNKLAVVFLPAKAYKEDVQLSKLGPFLVPTDSLDFWRMNIGLVVLLLTALLAAVAVVLKPKLLEYIASSKK
jgi:type III secretion protein J